MSTELTTADPAAIMEQVIIAGDLGRLAPLERVSYYRSVCDSLGLNPLTKPFEYISLNNKLTLYATKNCTDQLRQQRHVNIEIVSRERIDDLYVVTARASTPDGRYDESIGAVSIGNLKGEALANALMKGETKAKRRATLSLIGLSFTDESEIGSIPSAQPIRVNPDTGEIIDTIPQLATDEQRLELRRLTDLLDYKTANLNEVATACNANLRALTIDAADCMIKEMTQRFAKLTTPAPAPQPTTPAEEIDSFLDTVPIKKQASAAVGR